jgi:ATP-dependent DNA ligase
MKENKTPEILTNPCLDLPSPCLLDRVEITGPFGTVPPMTTLKSLLTATEVLTKECREDFHDPMLACTAKTVDDIPKKAFPLLVSAKLDGVRVRFTDEGLKFRSGKLVPNEFLQERAANTGGLLKGIEAEIIVGPPNLPTTFKTTSSFVRSKKATSTGDKSMSVSFYCFDIEGDGRPAGLRLDEVDKCLDRMVQSYMNEAFNVYFTTARQEVVYSRERVQEKYDAYIAEGFEGLIARSGIAIYKNGRSTLSKGEFIKVKPKGDSEGRIIGYTDQRDKAGELTGVVGCLILDSGDFINPVKVSSGMTYDDRVFYELNRYKMLGALVKFSYSGETVVGSKAPRHAVYEGMRIEEDT